MKNLIQKIQNWWNTPTQAYLDSLDKFLFGMLVIMVASCTKTSNDPLVPVVPIGDDMIFTENARPNRPQIKAAVVYLNCNGGLFSDRIFFPRDTMLAPYTGPKQPIVDWIYIAYSGYDILVTTDEQVFKRARNKHQVELYVTPTQLRGGTSGLANVGSIDAGPSKCLVFSNVLPYPDMIGKIAVHEIGHVIGMFHQKNFDSTCRVTDFNVFGFWMGQPSQAENPEWRNQERCDPQNDTAIINSRIKKLNQFRLQVGDGELFINSKIK